MTTPFDRAERRRERDRAQWSELYKRELKTLAKGTGEAYIEGVYFGAAYATPPFFEFSAVRAGDNPPSIKSRGFSHPRAKIAKEPRSNTGQYDSWFLDGSFEFHGMWDDYIVPWDQWTSDGYQKIWAEDVENRTNYPWSYKSDSSNHWVQQPSHNRWAISSERAHKHDIGASGQYSAKYTFGTDGEIGPWIVPIDAAGEYNPWDLTSSISDLHYMLVSYAFQMNWSEGYDDPSPFYPEGGGNNPGLVNPINEGMAHEVWLYSEQPYTFETWVTMWDFQDLDPDLGVFYNEHLSYKNEWKMKGDGWEKVEWTVFTPKRLLPGMPYPTYEDGSPAPAYQEGYWGTCRMRVKGGNKGQSVFLDDCAAWSHLNFNENPYITVGVAKWIRDDNGAYVGADLWVKIGDVGFQVNP